MQTKTALPITSKTQEAIRQTPPLSPHLGIYKPQLTSLLSILHRLCGVSLSLGSVFICIWLASILAGPSYFEQMHAITQSWFGQLVLFAWSWALIYHLSNGIRHLCWDLGIGLELTETYRSGWLVISASTLLTLIIWFVF